MISWYRSLALPPLSRPSDSVADLLELCRVGFDQVLGRGVEVAGHCDDVADRELHALDVELSAFQEGIALQRGERRRRAELGAELAAFFGLEKRR